MEIRRDPLTDPAVTALVRRHVADALAATVPESAHALGVEALRAPDVTFWTAWEGGDLAGCAALKELDPGHGEVKSMRTADAYLRRGVGAALLTHLLAEARRRGYRRVSLETGSMQAFAGARRLYEKFGFRETKPFASYVEDPNSVFLSLALAAGSEGGG